MARIALDPIAAPIVVGRYTAAQAGADLLDLIRISLAYTATAASAIAVFSIDDPNFVGGDITGTFDPNNPATWPNAGKGVHLLGLVSGGAANPGGAPLTLLQIGAAAWGLGFIILRTAGTDAVNVEVNGIGDPGGSVVYAAQNFIAGAGTDTARKNIFNNRGAGTLSMDALLLATTDVPIDPTDYINVIVSRTHGGVVTPIDTFTTSTTEMVPGSGGLTMPGAPYSVPQGDTLSAAVTHGGAGKAYNFTIQFSSSQAG